MPIRGKLPLLGFLFCFVLVSASLALAKEDPDLKQCKHQCKVQREYDQRQKQECEEECERYHKEKQRREREEEGRGGRGDDDGEEFWNPQRPEERLRECQRQCDRQHERQEERRECQRRCQEEYRREQEERGGGRRGRDLTVDNRKDPEEQYRRCKEGCERQRPGREQQQRCEERCEREYRQRQREGEGNPRHEGREEWEESEGQQQGRPFVFQDQHFTTKLQTEHGRIRLLQKFTERSELLRGVENYRVEILEADPQTFIVPHHEDAEAIIYVARGQGSISLVRQDKRESFNLKFGDVLRVPAGITSYFINRSNNQKLVLVKLIQPVSIPGHFEVFFGPGGEEPESYYKAFSTELLEAALNTRRDRLRQIFGQQREGAILKASDEQIRGMSHHEEGGIWPFGGESKGPFNLFHKRSSLSNQYGQLYEVDPTDSRELQELDLGVGFANISEGSMIAPYYNSRATKIAIVTDGEGYLEMACPHLASEEFRGEGRGERGGSERREERGGRTGPSYHKVRAQLRRGMVYVVPAGHPVITVASNNQNLEIVCFDVNARNNEKFLLAGRRNIMNQLEREAKELGFGVPAREVDEVFQSQDEEFFLRGPRQQPQHEGRAES